MSDKEVRVLNLDISKLQAEERADGSVKISGYAAVFDSDSEDMGFIERIKPGAFKAALKKSDTRALFNHDPNLIFGRAGVNLSMKEDKTGLYMEVDPINTTTYRMVEENIRSGLVTQQSFAFTVKEDEWNEDFTRRTINKVDQIFDVSPVTYPAYADTSVALRSLEKAKAITEKDGDVSGDEPPTSAPQAIDTEPESRTDSGGESPTSALQTEEELEARFQQKLLNYKGLF